MVGGKRRQLELPRDRRLERMQKEAYLVVKHLLESTWVALELFKTALLGLFGVIPVRDTRRLLTSTILRRLGLAGERVLVFLGWLLDLGFGGLYMI